MIHTQMTRLGDPMLDPGGEMEVSDVRLCCERDEGRGVRSRASDWWGGEAGCENTAPQET